MASAATWPAGRSPTVITCTRGLVLRHSRSANWPAGQLFVEEVAACIASRAWSSWALITRNTDLRVIPAGDLFVPVPALQG